MSVARRHTRAIMARSFRISSPTPPTRQLTRRPPRSQILEQCGGKLDAFVACVGSGGTIAGIGRVLRARLPSVSIVGAATQPHSVVEGVIR